MEFEIIELKDSTSLNIIIEQYNNGKLVKTIDFLNKVQPLLRMTDEPNTHYFPQQNAAQPPYRFYVKYPQNGNAVIHLSNGNLGTQYEFENTA